MHLLCITGPPAVGKMTVGRAVCDLTGYRLFHNHVTIEPLISLFGYGTPSFTRLNSLFRREVMVEAVAADLPGLVFTYATDFDNPRDLEHLRWLIEPVLDAGIRVDAVELYAAQDVRLAREGLPDRVEHKPSKRDVGWAREHVVELDARARFNTAPGAAIDDGGWPWPWMPHLALDNAHSSAATTAERIVDALGLPQ
ncbi:MAG TPA: hypothetical protein VFN43_08025 [Humibacillus sp.]|nr:hypothetical protein [Humibacillus sp.]